MEESLEYVNSHRVALDTVDRLFSHQGIVALDTETTGCNPKLESPVGRARLFCITLCREYSNSLVSTYIPLSYSSYFLDWIESLLPKVGSNILGYDSHVLSNHGIQLNGVVGDTQRMSQLLDSDKNFGHGLKAWGERLGIDTVSFKNLTSRLTGAKVMSYKRDSAKLGRYAGAEFQKLSMSGGEYAQEMIDVETLWNDYPQRREKLIRYAVQDAKMSLLVYKHLRNLLEDKQW